ncbi:MAG: response regulator transcription factor [Chloroflexi bacterium]|nr:response regulator transcription factor [Chloroflexota bacterium]
MVRDDASHPIRVLVADDHAIVREGICSLLARRKDIELVGQAADGRQAVEQVAALSPDVVLMDISMPAMNGLEATVEIRRSHPQTRILVLSQYESKEYVLPLLRAGAAGYIGKRARASEMVDAIRAVYRDGAYLQPSIARAIVEESAQPPEPESRDLLTEREKQVVQLVADGMSSREIAEQLGLSVKTIDTHRANIMEKLGIHSSAELVKYAIREGIVSA